MEEIIIVMLLFEAISFVVGFYLGVFYGAYLMLKDYGFLPGTWHHHGPHPTGDNGGRRSCLFRFIPQKNSVAAPPTHFSHKKEEQ